MNVPDGKKDFVLRFPEIFIKDCLEKLRSLDDGTLSRIRPTLNELLDSNSKNHLELLKQVSRHVPSSAKESNLIAEILLNGLYYHTEGSSAVKSTLTGMIGRWPQDEIEVLTKIVQQKLECSTKTVSLIFSLLQNDVGSKIITQCIDSILDHFLNLLNHLLKQYKVEKTALESARILTDIHLATRTLLSIMKFNENRSKTESILCAVISVLNLKEIPLDVQNNCSKILVLSCPSVDKIIETILNGSTDDLLLANLNDSDSSRLNLCLALLTTLNSDGLAEFQPHYGSIIGGVILPTLLKLGKGLNDTNLALLVARLLEQWMSKFHQILADNLADKTVLIKEWSSAREELLESVLNGMEHQISSVQHSAKEGFHSYLKICLLLNDETNVEKVMRDILNMPMLKKSKYMALSRVAKTPELISALWRMTDNLADELLRVTEDPALSNQAKEVFNLLMYQDMKNQNRSWIHHWLYPLLEAIVIHPEGQSLETSLVELLKKRPETILDVECWFLQDRSRHLRVYITALLAYKRLGHQIDSFPVDALRHYDSKVRLTAFGVIIEGPKSTQMFTEVELGWVQDFLKENMNNGDPAFRQQLCSYMKKFLGRFSNNQKESYCKDFRSWLINKCLSDLGPGSSFSRRFLSLNFLKMMQLGDEDVEHPSQITSLLDCFFDSYDSNKDLALDLLKTRPFINQALRNPEKKDFYWRSSLELSQSVRPSDVSAASYFYRWIIRLNEDPFKVLQCLVESLKIQLEVGQIGYNSPIYGLTSSIHSVLGSIVSEDCKRIDECMVHILVEGAFEASRIASPVVTSDSPEGFLPDDPSSTNLDAQTYLVCAWRTIKEVALLLGYISSLALKAEEKLLDTNSILRIGSHLRQLLLEIKHRGAFEQVYCGFSQLCNALWRCSDKELCQLPARWLEELLSDLKSDDSNSSKLCATRRSAGLPFMFQAILSVEVELGGSDLFSKSMNSLLGIASEGSAECRIHALNILRTLYRESRLNQVIGPHVARGLILSITGFEAQDWPERNSCTLLFSSLMTRIFGVPRSRTDFHKRNSLSGRVFFQLYPQLYPFLLDRFRIALNKSNHNEIHLHPSLFPCLIVMGRLTASSSENPDAIFQLHPFIHLIQQCGSPPVLKTRQLAAQALSPLLDPANVLAFLEDLLKSVLEQPKLHNQLHGTILQILQIVKDHSIHANLMTEWIPKLMILVRNPSYLIRYEFVALLEHFSDPKIFDILLKELENYDGTKNDEPFLPLYYRRVAKLLLPDCDPARLLSHPLPEVRLEVLEHLNRSESCNLESLKPTLAALLEIESSLEAQILLISILSRCSTNLIQPYLSSNADELRCAALSAFNPDQDRSLWSRYLAESMDSSIVIRSISKNWKLLNEMIELWPCLLRSLIDDDDVVRTTASMVVSNLTDTIETHPAVALESALSYFVGHFGPSDPFRVIETLCGIVLGNSSDDELMEESQSFGKGDDCDSFWEPLEHSRIFCKFIGMCVEKNPGIPKLDSLSTALSALDGFNVAKRRSLRLYVIELCKLFQLSGSLQLSDIHSEIKDRLRELPDHCITHSLHQLMN